MRRSSGRSPTPAWTCGGFEALRPHSEPIRIFDRDVLCLDLPTLIRTKRAAGRPRDLEAIAELETIAEERQRGA